MCLLTLAVLFSSLSRSAPNCPLLFSRTNLLFSWLSSYFEPNDTFLLVADNSGTVTVM